MMVLNKLDEALSKIKLLVLDVDGTLTDGTVYCSENGESLKRFSIRDGMGVLLLKKAGITVAIITSENSNIVKARASKLEIKHIVLGSRNKRKDLMHLIEDINIKLEETAFMGDDVNDLSALELVGVSVCPSNAVESVIKVCDYVCQNAGGYGAVREFSEKILLSQNKSITLPENW